MAGEAVRRRALRKAALEREEGRDLWLFTSEGEIAEALKMTGAGGVATGRAQQWHERVESRGDDREITLRSGVCPQDHGSWASTESAPSGRAVRCHCPQAAHTRSNCLAKIDFAACL